MKKITLFFSLLAMMIVGLQAQAADVYTVCGSSSALFGNTWDPTNTANDMTLQDGSYVLVKENVALNSGLIEYKVVKNHVWGEGEVPSSGNKSFSIAESGTYNVTFKLSDSELAADVQLVSESPVQFDATARKFAVTGAAFGGWNMPPAANQTFTNNGDGTYTLKFEGAKAAGFKLSGVGINDVFDENWSVFNGGVLGKASLAEGDNDLSNEFGSAGNMTFPVSGNVTLTISDVTESSCKLNITVDQEIVPDKAWYIAGSFTNWADGKLALVGNDDGTFSITVQGVQAGAEFKFINENGGWFGGETTDISANNCTDIALSTSGDNFKIASGGGDLTFTIDAENKLTVTGWEEPVVDYLLHYGTASSEWQDVTFVAGEGENEGKLVATATFAENTEIGIKHGATWYAGLVEQGDNYIIKYDWCTNIPLDSEGNIKNFLIAEAGTYTFVLTVGEEGITMDVQGLVEPQTEYLLHYGHDGENDWQNATFVAGEGTYEGKLVAKDVEFTAVKTQFGVKYGDIWYAGLPNAGEGLYWIHDTWCTDIPLSTGDGVKNFIINEIGTYTFVLTVGGNGITMDVEGFPVAPVLGDLNGDGKADVTDVNIIVNMILGKQAKTEAGNLNGDDDVDVTDVNLLVNIILGKSGDTTGEGE